MARPPIAIDDLRPTQLTLGLAEVRQRAEAIEKMSHADREALLDRKAVPHVLGPEGQVYQLDHHHLARALWSCDVTEMVLGERVADWSELALRPFWRKMEASGYCWPIDADGIRRPYAAIPRHIRELTDNVWRSLAREVRGKAFENQDTPFQEFMWGDYFRTFMSRRLIDLEFDLAVDVAVRLARLDEAQDLPGFRG